LGKNFRLEFKLFGSGSSGLGNQHFEVKHLKMNNLLIIKVNPLESEDALELIRELDRELLQRYPGESVHVLDLTKVNENNAVFLVGYLYGMPVVCGAISKLDGQTGEIKRVFVKPEARGLGLSKLMLTRLEKEALAMGFKLLRLETGAEQPEALGLYRKSGYYDIPKYGEYVDDPRSICMEKRLT
jgi:ribosomal protein S18 acetylase RimI-like enzyme